jgi:hypothetical protein
MYEHWYEIRDSLLTGLEEHDAATVKERLDSLYGVNRRYLDVATKRLAELMVEDEVAAPKGLGEVLQMS